MRRQVWKRKPKPSGWIRKEAETVAAAEHLKAPDHPEVPVHGHDQTLDSSELIRAHQSQCDQDPDNRHNQEPACRKDSSAASARCGPAPTRSRENGCHGGERSEKPPNMKIRTIVHMIRSWLR